MAWGLGTFDIRDEARLVDFGLECPNKEMHVKSPTNENDDDDNTNAEHLLCGKYCTQNAIYLI